MESRNESAETVGEGTTATSPDADTTQPAVAVDSRDESADTVDEPAASTRTRARRQADTPRRPRRKRKRKRKQKPTQKRKPLTVKPRDQRLPPPAGTVLTRVVDDVEHRVNVLEDGFEYDGEVYSSISRVARAVSGTRYNGYVFFRLSGPWKEKEDIAPPQ